MNIYFHKKGNSYIKQVVKWLACHNMNPHVKAVSQGSQRLIHPALPFGLVDKWVPKETWGG